MESSSLTGDDFIQKVMKSGVHFGGRPLCTMARPLFLPPQKVIQYSRLLRGFHEAIRFVREMIVSDGLEGDEDSLAIRLGIPRDALSLAAIPVPDDSASILARVDTFCPKGHPWLIELNAESPAGMGYGDRLNRLFLNELPLNIPATLQGLYSVPAAVSAILDSYIRVEGHSRPPRVAIVDLNDVQTRPEFLVFQLEFQSRGLECIICDPGELDFDDVRLSHKGKPIDLVYRRLLVDDILAHPSRTEALISAYKAQSIVMVNSLRTTLLHCKGLFALLHDPMVFELLPQLAQEMVIRHIPWTGILSDRPGLGSPPNLQEIVRQNRESWVIKPLRGHGGTGVVMGNQVTQSEWDQAVQNAQSHVAQRLIHSSSERFPDATNHMEIRPMQVDINPYLIRGRLAGFLCRLSQHSIANIHQGASQVPVLVNGKVPWEHLPDLKPLGT